MIKPEKGPPLYHDEFVLSGFDIPSSFDIRASSFVSFVPECFDWIERGGFACGIESKENAHGRAEQKCNGN
jgi:hypothetical protein